MLSVIEALCWIVVRASYQLHHLDGLVLITRLMSTDAEKNLEKMDLITDDFRTSSTLLSIGTT